MARSKGLLGSLMFLFGLVFGGLITILLSTDDKGEMRDQIKDKVKQLKDKLKEASETERIKEIFGQVTTEATKRYQEAKEMLITKLAGLKASINDIDQDKYKSVVSEVIAQLKKDGSMTAAELKKLGAFLSEDYHKLTRKDIKKGKAV